MPALGGIAMLHTLRQDGWQTPVILLTGHILSGEYDELQGQEVATLLTKPPTLNQLAQMAAAALGNQPSN